MIYIYNLILYKPIFNFFVGLYNVLPGHDIGLVILIITVLIRVILYPLTNSSIKSQKALQELQPKMDDIKKTYANDQQKQAKALMELYKSNKVNPFSSCLPLLIQLPILIALYSVMRNGLILEDVGKDLYSFVYNPGHLNQISLGFINMAKPSIVLAVLAGAAQFWQAKMLNVKRAPKVEGAKDEDMMAMMNKQMLYMMPVMTVVIGATLPAGLTLYWFFSTLFTALQQLFLFKKHNDKSDTKPNVIDGQIVEEKK